MNIQSGPLKAAVFLSLVFFVLLAITFSIFRSETASHEAKFSYYPRVTHGLTKSNAVKTPRNLNSDYRQSSFSNTDLLNDESGNSMNIGNSSSYSVNSFSGSNNFFGKNIAEPAVSDMNIQSVRPNDPVFRSSRKTKSLRSVSQVQRLPAIAPLKKLLAVNKSENSKALSESDMNKVVGVAGRQKLTVLPGDPLPTPLSNEYLILLLFCVAYGVYKLTKKFKIID